MNIIKPPFNVNQVAQIAAIELLKIKILLRSIKHNIIWQIKLKIFEIINIISNEVTANFLLLILQM